MNQFICQTCDAEYEIVTDSEVTALFCPFCGELHENFETEEDEDIYDDGDDWDDQDRERF
jgi:hypothetical protein